MSEPSRTEWQIRCAFNGYCKRALKNEAINAHRDTKNQQQCFVTFSDLTAQEENQLYAYDEYFTDDEADKTFCAAGKTITAKLIAEALRSLPEEKRNAVLLYYFFDMKDAEIAALYHIPRIAPMIGTTKRSDNDESGLLPYPVIIAATKGDPEAMKAVVQHYESSIARMSMRKLRDQSGNTYWGIDEDIRDRLRSKLMLAVLSFRA